MSTNAATAGAAELWLISDFPVDDRHLALIRQLFGVSTSNQEVEFRSDRKVCRWPLRVPYEAGDVAPLSFHVYLCAGFLIQRRRVVEQIHALGCNLELCLHVTELTDYFSMASATMQQLAELEIQFSLMPRTA